MGLSSWLKKTLIGNPEDNKFKKAIDAEAKLEEKKAFEEQYKISRMEAAVERGIVVIAYAGDVNYEELDKVIEVFSLSMHIVPIEMNIFNVKLQQLKALNADIFEISPDAFKKI